ncbi:MAG TPA: SGNH/GDSL hydrolase family protein [Ktedonobacteraceae bacterium]|nr:SGNH/GDSL hydrolase family protein [Ktedonobacteraceae bacterium]
MPAFSSSAAYPASNADDSSYDTTWRSQGAPAWLAYDLSSVPATKRSTILLVWYNDDTGLYDHTLIGYPAYNLPKDYTIEVNAAPGGGQAPKTGWVVKATVKNNHFHSRQHVIDMEGYNWIRMNITAIDGSVENEDASLNLDIFDARTALSDDWIFYGDSITAGAMGHQTLNGVLSFSQLINAKVPNSYPVQEAGGTGYLTSADGAKDLATWLALFPGKYVGLSYGTNDALGCVNPDTFYSNYVAMIQDVLRAGKVPLVPRIPWGKDANIQRCGPALNAQIEKLYSTFPQIIHGPDFWGFFQNQQNLISNDTIHPTDAGFAAYRQQWANTMLAEIYKR